MSDTTNPHVREPHDNTAPQGTPRKTQTHSPSSHRRDQLRDTLPNTRTHTRRHHICARWPSGVMTHPFAAFLPGLRTREVTGTLPRFPFTYTPPALQLKSGGADVLLLPAASDTTNAQVATSFATDQGDVLPFAVAHANRARNGALIAIADELGAIALVDTTSPRPKLLAHVPPPSPNAALFDVSFAPSDTLLVAAGGDSLARIIDVDTATVTTLLAGHAASVKTAVFSPVSPSLVATSARDGTILLWDLRCAAFATDPIASIPIHKPVDALRRSHDPSTIPTTVSRPLSAGARSNPLQMSTSTSTTATIGGGGGGAATPSSRTTLMSLFSPTTHDRTRSPSGTPSRGSSPATTPRTQHHNSTMPNNSVSNSLSSASCVRFLDGGNPGVMLVSCGSADGAVKLWDIRNLGSVAHKRSKAATPSISVNPHDYIVPQTSAQPTLTTKNSLHAPMAISANSLLRNSPSFSSIPGIPLHSSSSTTSTRTSVESSPTRAESPCRETNQSQSTYNLNEDDEQSSRQHITSSITRRSRTDVSLSNPFLISSTSQMDSEGNNNMLTSSTSGISLSSAPQQTTSISTIKMHRRRGFATMALSRDMTRIYAVSTDNHVYELQSSTLQPVKRFTAPGFSVGSFYIRADANDNYLAIGSSNSCAYVWPLDSVQNNCVVLAGHTSEVTGVSLRKKVHSDLDISLATCSDDNTTRIWRQRSTDSKANKECLEGFAMDWDGTALLSQSSVEYLRAY